MSVAVLSAVDLLERAVGYTRGTLAGVTPAAMGDPTPCRGWDLRRLLGHMDDALVAFTEASAGHVDLRPPSRDEPLLDRLRTRACTLLGAWAEPPARPEVVVGDRPLATALLVRAGALEITLHGWDVGRATGRPAPVPAELARLLLPVASALIGPEDRPARFAAARPTAPGASYADRLVAVAGRDP